MKFKLPQLPNVSVPASMTLRRGESLPPPLKRQPSKFEASVADFGNKSKEQMTTLFKKAKTSLTPKSKQANNNQEPAPECYETTVLKRSNSDPHVAATLKSILKGRKGSKQANKAANYSNGADDGGRQLSSSTSELGRHIQQQQHHGQSYEDFALCSSNGPPHPARKHHHHQQQGRGDERVDLKALAQQYNYDMPPRPSRRKGSITNNAGRVGARAAPHLDDSLDNADLEHGADGANSKFPCPFVFETHDTFGCDTEAFVEMLTQNILQESWDSSSDRRQMASGKGSSSSAPSTVKRGPGKSSPARRADQDQVGSSLMKALELQVEIEMKLKNNKEANEQRMKEIQKWQEELKAIKIPEGQDVRGAKKQIQERIPAPAAKEVPHYATVTQSLGGRGVRRRHLNNSKQELDGGASAAAAAVDNKSSFNQGWAPTELPSSSTGGNNNKRRQASHSPTPRTGLNWQTTDQKIRSMTMPRHNTTEIIKPSAPGRRKKTGGSCYSLPDWKTSTMGTRYRDTSESDANPAPQSMKNRPLPPPPRPSRVTSPHQHQQPTSAAGGDADGGNNDDRENRQHQQQQHYSKPITIEDVPPDVVAAIVEISRSAILGDLAHVVSRAVKRDKDGYLDELKVRKLSIDELSAVKIVVGSLAAKNTKGDKASFAQIYTSSQKSNKPSLLQASNKQDSTTSYTQSVDDDVSREDGRGFETVSEMTATFESVPGGETTESSSHMDTDLDCDSDLEGSIKSVEVAFDAIEDTLQTFKETIAGGPSTAAASHNIQ